MRPRVSVIVPTYNRAPYIARTLEAILRQTLAPFEVIVIDDGSSDETAAVCALYADRVRYSLQENGGVSTARNRGAAIATGEWLAFCDSDDVWHPEKLAAQFAALGASGGRWSVTGAETIDLEDQPVPERSGFSGIFPVFGEVRESAHEFFATYLVAGVVENAGHRVEYFHGDAYLPLFLGNFGLPSSFVVDREVFRASTGFDPAFRLAEDTEFFHRLSVTEPVTVVMESLVGYRVAQANSLVSSANIVRLIEVAILSNSKAALLRTGHDERHLRQMRRGRVGLLRKLARAELSIARGPAARRALLEARSLGDGQDLLWNALLALSWVPKPLLQAGLWLWRRIR